MSFSGRLIPHSLKPKRKSSLFTLSLPSYDWNWRNTRPEERIDSTPLLFIMSFAFWIAIFFYWLYKKVFFTFYYFVEIHFFFVYYFVFFFILCFIIFLYFFLIFFLYFYLIYLSFFNFYLISFFFIYIILFFFFSEKWVMLFFLV